MEKAQLVVKDAKIYMAESNTLIHGSIVVRNGKISGIVEGKTEVEAETYLSASGMLLLPGGIDPHVHLRDPGNSERETFATGTMAAASGGVTTIIEHPISKPPQYSREILQNRIDVAKPQAFVDFGFVGAAGGKYLDQIRELSGDRILGYKTFLHKAPNGRDEEFRGLTMENDYELYQGLLAVAETGLHCLVHAEDDDLIQGMIQKYKSEGKYYPLAHTETRPTISEVASVNRVMTFAKEVGATIEFCHISTPEAMEAIKKEKKNGASFYLETCPHYLFLNTEDLKKYGPYAKCNPPLRSPEDMEKLWAYIEDGTVDLIGSDHAPFLVEEKEKGKNNIFESVSGFPGIDLRLPLMLTAVKEKKLSLQRCVELLSTNPAKIFGIFPKKGTLSIGSDADFVIVDMEKTFTVDREKMYTKAKEIARVYEGRKLWGKPIHTVVRGKIIMEDGIIKESDQGYGELVERTKQGDEECEYC